MPNYTECPKCGSSDILPKQKIVSTEGGSSVEYRAIVRLREKTGTWRVRSHDHPIVAWICGNCGYTELYTAKAKELSDTYQRLQQAQSERGLSPDDKQGSDTASNRAFLILTSVMLFVMLLSIIALVVLLGIPRG